MKFKVTLRNKIDGSIENKIVEANNEDDARYEAWDQTNNDFQILSSRPLRSIGEKPAKPVSSTYVSVKRLRARVERDLCNKQMNLGKYSPEAIAAQRVKEQLENAKELANELSFE
jgi:hypothetical protein